MEGKKLRECKRYFNTDDETYLARKYIENGKELFHRDVNPTKIANSVGGTPMGNSVGIYMKWNLIGYRREKRSAKF